MRISDTYEKKAAFFLGHKCGGGFCNSEKWHRVQFFSESEDLFHFIFISAFFWLSQIIKYFKDTDTNLYNLSYYMYS